MLNFRNFAKQAGDSDDQTFRKLLILMVSLSCCFCGVIWTTMYWLIFGFGIISSLPALFVLLVGTSIVIAHYLRKYEILIYAQLICITWIPTLIQWWIGSMGQSGLVIAWSFLGPLGALIFLSRRESLLWMIMFLAILIISAVIEPAFMGKPMQVSVSVRILFYIMNIGAALSLVFATAYWFVRTIQEEKKHSDDLLLNILPEEVAKELKQNGFSKPRHFENVSVLFTDFVEFTVISEKLTPTQLVKEIDHCFSEFDKIMERHGLEKIKTIGDAYLAVCGLPMEDFNHAINTVEAAKEIIAFIEKREIEGGHFKIRIGINSGPVVAGIVGVRKYAYDIWGDTVNTAARMEQNSEHGKINISESTYSLVKNSYQCKFRGKIDAKNKGEINMYFIESYC
jgi:class 3 adenylate cyclase